MNQLSRPEEQIMLSILKLKENAYCVTIREGVSDITGKDWSFGAIYVPLHRLEKKGMVESFFGDPTPERGGRRKRFYKLTTEGLKALAEVRKIQESMWKGVPDLGVE